MSAQFTQPKPPGTLHEMLAMAIEDFKAILKDPRYRVEMSTWHNYDPDKGVCYVCLAGSVIAKHLAPDSPTTWKGFDSISTQWNCALEALNSIRMGLVIDAINEYYAAYPGTTRPAAGDDANLTAANKILDQPGMEEVLIHRLEYSSFDQDNPEPFLAYLDNVHAFLKREAV